MFPAGDHVKFGFPLAWSTTTLLWGLVEFRDGYEAAGELDNMLNSVRWPLDYFTKCHVSDTQFYAQVADGYADHAEWTRPESMTTYRPSFSVTDAAPGSDVAGETAAAFAAGSMAFRDTGASMTGISNRFVRFSFNFYSFRFGLCRYTARSRATSVYVR